MNEELLKEAIALELANAHWSGRLADRLPEISRDYILEGLAEDDASNWYQIAQAVINSVKTESKPAKTYPEVVLNALTKPMSRKELIKALPALDNRQISNALYRLKKENRVEHDGNKKYKKSIVII